MTAEEAALISGDRCENPSREGKAVMLVAYHFPPAAGQALPGSQRAMKLCRYLPEFGWKPHVLTVSPPSYPWYIEQDPSLLEVLPSDQGITRTGVVRVLWPLIRTKNSITGWLKNLGRRVAGRQGQVGSGEPAQEDGERADPFRKAKDFITELFEIPDESSGWIIPAARRGRRLARQQEIAAIIATGRPWSSLVIGGILSRISKVPLVTDFRDPWMTNPFRAQHSALKNRLDLALERFVIRQSSLVIANTDSLRDEFIERFPDMDEDKFICVSNGFDPGERMCQGIQSENERARDKFVLVHAGFLYGRRDPRSLIDAVELVVQNGRLKRDRLVLKLVGPRELPFSLENYISNRGLEDVIEVVDAVPYEESLRLVSGCAMSVLIQPDTLTQVPSKLFENIGLGKRTLAIAEPGSATERLFRTHDLGYFSGCDNVTQIADSLVGAYEDWQREDTRFGLTEDLINKFNIRSRIEVLAKKLDEIADAPAGSVP